MSSLLCRSGGISGGFNGLTDFSSTLAERLGRKEELGEIIGITITCKQTVTMRANRANAPYTVEKTVSTHKIWLFGQNEAAYVQMQTLLKESTGSRFSWQNNETVRQMVDARDEQITFDQENFENEGAHTAL